MALLLLAAGDAAAQANNCQNISGHIAGQIIGPSALCSGAVTEIGTFTGAGGGSFVACITGIQTNGDGTIVFNLAHTYTTSAGDTFTTTDHVVAAPVDPPTYRINNRVDITGGTGSLADAFGFFRTHGTVNLASGVVSVDYRGRICTP
jgi:hypothetical protein